MAGVAAFLASLASGRRWAALLTEPATGLVLYAEDADLPWRPASLTKLMTAYLTFEAICDGQLSPEDVVISTTLSQSQPPSKLGMPLGAQLTVDLADQGADREIRERRRDHAGGESRRVGRKFRGHDEQTAMRLA